MNVFDIDYINYVWYLLTPPDLREPVQQAWGASVMSGKQWKASAFFDGYMNGNPSPAPTDYSPTATYTTGQRVIYRIQSYTAGFTGGYAYYGDNAVYEAISINADGSNNSGFTNVAPVGSNVVSSTPPASALANTTAALEWLSGFYWVQVYPNFIGANLRVSFTAQKLVFEYALNLWFETTFRQPAVGTPDIYISTNTVNTNRYYCGPNPNNPLLEPTEQGYSPKGSVNALQFVGPKLISADFGSDFTIYIPNAVYNALTGLEAPVSAGVQTEGTIRWGIVASFVNKINAAGMIFSITTY